MNADFWLRMAVAILWIIGVWNAFKKGMIFGTWGDWLYDWNEIVSKPIFACPPCMASLHGILIWGATGGEWPLLLPFIVCLSGAMKILTSTLLRNG